MHLELGPIEQLRLAILKQPIAGLVGAMLGGWVPLATFTVAHEDLLVGEPTLQSLCRPAAALVAGGLLYSAKTVWQWGRLAFDDAWKATGFVLLLEGVMIFANGWLAHSALCYLALINAIATGCRLALRHEADHAERNPSDSDGVMASGEAVAASGEVAVADGFATDATALLEVLEPTLAPAQRARQRDESPIQRSGPRAASAEALYQRAVEYAVSAQRCSISALQCALNVGYPRAAKLVDRMEREGVIGPATKAGACRVVLAERNPHAGPTFIEAAG